MKHMNYFLTQERTFRIKMSTWALLGYLLATVPQLLIDPELTSHYRFGARHYHYWWIVIPLSVGVLLVTWLILKRLSQHRVFWASIPLILSLIISIPFFGPEIPHGNIVFVSFLWLTISMTTIWIHDAPLPNSQDWVDKVGSDYRRDYVKEYVSLWKTLLLGTFAGYLGIVISMLSAVYTHNKSFLNHPGEIFLVNINSSIQIGFTSLFILTGPLFEAANKVLQGMRSFLTLTNTSVNGDSSNRQSR